MDHILAIVSLPVGRKVAPHFDWWVSCRTGPFCTSAAVLVQRSIL